jgi:GDP-mannose 6-dehydrogenase
MNISIFGLGYVGCVSMGCLADMGHKVIGTDKSSVKINLINSGKPTIIEKGIDKLIAKYHSESTIAATMDVNYVVNESEISIICVGTPALKDGKLNLEYIFNCAKEIGLALRNKNDFHTIVIRSTVIPGTNQKVGEIISSESGKIKNKDFGVVSNPEFLREGSAVKDFFNPPLTLLGSESSNALLIMKEIYKEIPAEIVETDVKVAEIIKYVNNSYHALKISFANEVGNICKEIGIDSYKVMDIFCKDKKLNISDYYFRPGFAYGGSCLPKDLGAMVALSKEYELESYVLSAIDLSNEYQKKMAFNIIRNTNKRKIGIVGITFKPGTDDLRYSPMIDILKWLIQDNYSVSVFDENVRTSLLMGANKEYTHNMGLKLDEILLPSMEELFNKSEVVVISQIYNELFNLIDKYKDRIIIDFVRISGINTGENYIGICW